MARIPDNVIQDILDKADIESVVGKYVAFTKRTGANKFGLCPFHSEKTPSFSVSLNKGIYHCFGCGKTGNSIGFIMEIERLSFIDAVKFLGKEYGVEIPETGTNEGNNRQERDRVYSLLTEAARFYYLTFTGPEGVEARKYAQKRNLSTATLRNFGIGYSPDKWDALYKHLSSKGYTDEEMGNSGLFTVSKKNGKLLDLFRNRLMFPIFDAFGKIVAFGGRSMGDDMPKYINSPDSLVYKKQEHLYAFNFAKKSREKQLIIVEGYMDAIAMHQAGITNSVAALGTAFTDSQLKLASKYAEEVVFFFDADKAGQAAALRAIKMLLTYLKKHSGIKIRIKIACVPEGKDPDEFIKANGPDEFRKVVKAAKDVDTYLFDRAYNDSFYDDELDVPKYEDYIIEYGSWIGDDVKQYRFATNAALYIKAPAEILVNRMNEVADKEGKTEESMSLRSIERDHNEEIERRKIASSENKPKNGIAEDFVTELEMEVFCYAILLKGNLTDPQYISTPDIIRPGDFYGENMKKIVEFFLTHFVKGVGLREDVLVGELSNYNLNNEQAEIVYIKYAEKMPLNMGVSRLRGEYLIRLYKLRREMLLQKKTYILKMLDKTSDPAVRDKYYEDLKKIELGLEFIKKQEENL